MEARAQIAIAAGLLAALVAGRADAQPSEAARAEARLLHEEGRRHYELAEYDQAIEAFRRAYARDPFPGFLFDAAQAHRLRARPGDCEIAERLYRNYLRLAPPDAPHRDEIAKLAEEMGACAGSEAASRPPTVRSRPEPVVVRRRRPVAALVVAGSGAAVALGGLGLFLWSRSEASQLEEECAPACDPERLERPRQAERIGLGALGVGGAAALAGAAWWFFGGRADEQQGAARAWIAPTPAGIALGGSF